MKNSLVSLIRDMGFACRSCPSETRRNLDNPPFYALDAELPVVLAIASGLQHAVAMLAGLITPPIIFASVLSLNSATSAYMISA
jgi:xanthine/uracil permease